MKFQIIYFLGLLLLVSCNSKPLTNDEKAIALFEKRFTTSLEKKLYKDIKILSINIDSVIVSSINYSSDNYLVFMQNEITDIAIKTKTNRDLALIWGEAKYYNLYKKGIALHDSLCIETQKYIKSHPFYLGAFEIKIEYLRPGKTESQETYIFSDSSISRELSPIEYDKFSHIFDTELGPFAYNLYN